MNEDFGVGARQINFGFVYTNGVRKRSTGEREEEALMRIEEILSEG